MQEIWKDIEGFDGKYQISNMGNLRSFTFVKKGELIKPATDKRGYKIVMLSRGTRAYRTKYKQISDITGIPTDIERTYITV